MKIFQILPDVFENDVEVRQALTLQVNKKYTGSIVYFLKSFIAEKTIFIKYSEKKNTDYSFGKYNSKNKKIKNEFIEIDVSFLKMVKSISNDENLILISFVEV
jgi:hypothetical protein